MGQRGKLFILLFDAFGNVVTMHPRAVIKERVMTNEADKRIKRLVFRMMLIHNVLISFFLEYLYTVVLLSPHILQVR